MATRATAGSLNERVTIQQPPSGVDTQGGPIGAPTALATVWARLEPLDRREGLVAGAQTSNVRYRVTIRQRTDVTAAMTLRWRGATLQITAVVNDPADRLYTALECVSRS